MSFRVRLTLLAALAVAVAIVGASFAVYFIARNQLLGEIDAQLAEFQPAISSPGFHGTGATPTPIVVTSLVGGTLLVTPTTSPMRVTFLPASGQTKSETRWSTETIAGVRSRALTVSQPWRSIRLSVPLVATDSNLKHLRWLLTLVSLGGIGIAVLLGTLVSRTAVAPLRRLTATTDRIIDTGDLSQRVGSSGRDELGRLSGRLDELLGTLEESQAAQRALVADASHELRTPIASLRANIELLANPRGLDEEEREGMLRDARQELESLSTLVAELLELARGEEADASATDIRLDLTVQASVDRVARHAPGLSFETELEPTVVHGVPQRIERAVTNLLDNARKWSPEGGTVSVAVRDGTVEVRDQGPGIADEDRPHVFDRFYRAASARGMPGAGLGLAIVKQIADAQGGEVSVDAAPGGGAIVRLRFS